MGRQKFMPALASLLARRHNLMAEPRACAHGLSRTIDAGFPGHSSIQKVELARKEACLSRLLAEGSELSSSLLPPALFQPGRELLGTHLSHGELGANGQPSASQLRKRAILPLKIGYAVEIVRLCRTKIL